MRGMAVASFAALCLLTFAATSAAACDMSNSMTDASCANEGFPNVFNNPAPTMSPWSDDDGPSYAINLPGLLAGDGSPIVCRRGFDCPGDAMAPRPYAMEPVVPARVAAHRHTRHARRLDRRRMSDASLR